MAALTTLQAVLQTGIHSARPAANAVGSGSLYACSTHGLIYQSDGTSWATWATLGGSAGTMIALKQYAPGADGTVLNAGAATTVTDIDATNAAVTFTAPATGNVLVRLSALCTISNPGGIGYWSLRDGSTLKDEAWCLGDGSGSPTQPVAARKTVGLYVAGLTPSTSYTYKWAYRVNNASWTHTIYAGPSYGRLLLEVWAAP